MLGVTGRRLGAAVFLPLLYFLCVGTGSKLPSSGRRRSPAGTFLPGGAVPSPRTPRTSVAHVPRLHHDLLLVHPDNGVTVVGASPPAPARWQMPTRNPSSYGASILFFLWRSLLCSLSQQQYNYANRGSASLG
jgi:hypothetical protein